MIVPFIPLSILALGFLGLSLTAFAYSVAIGYALHSPMAFLVFFAGFFIFLGLCIADIKTFITYLKYYSNMSDNKELKENNTKQINKLKKYVNLTNICLALLFIGCIFAIISAFLGSIHRENWVEAKSDYMQEHGYYEDIQIFDLDYVYTTIRNDENDVKVEIDLQNKNAVIIYGEPSDMIKIKGFQSYQNQIVCFGYNNQSLIKINETPPPKLDGNIEKMLFFFFDENKYEAQLKIYIPSNYKDSIEIVGDYIIAKN